ncbi:hypothetical protein NUW54_g497 [Trametes sanguinea]|uniref:Uncharacterized protein n=2 Tax=Trametes sanguinea TaxID=158606 RepID=A0ACC1QA03_9APHY|nr:hypothetical protein NUW54_g812 [Trametes sanguinea]KAJ3017811.1 hypothetical protein NUW54_g497 [Trametes sanguinea]
MLEEVVQHQTQRPSQPEEEDEPESVSDSSEDEDDGPLPPHSSVTGSASTSTHTQATCQGEELVFNRSSTAGWASGSSIGKLLAMFQINLTAPALLDLLSDKPLHTAQSPLAPIDMAESEPEANCNVISKTSVSLHEFLVPG